MKTKEAFLKLFNKRGVLRKLGIKRGTYDAWRQRINKKQYPLESSMFYWLVKAGYTQNSEGLWFEPKDK